MNGESIGHPLAVGEQPAMATSNLRRQASPPTMGMMADRA
jgi:hypothetical protein